MTSDFRIPGWEVNPQLIPASLISLVGRFLAGKIRLLQVPGRLWRHLVIVVKHGLERMM